MSTERRRILGMLAEGKISLDECEEMLSALPQESKVETKPPVKKKSSGGLTTCLIVALVGGVVFVLLLVLAFVLFNTVEVSREPTRIRTIENMRPIGPPSEFQQPQNAEGQPDE